MLSRLFLLVLFLLYFSLTSVEYSQSQKAINWGLQTSFGITYTNSSQTNDDAENLELLLTSQANLNYVSENFHFDLDMFTQFGQLVARGKHPRKTVDNFILNLVPSFKLFESPATRLFWQTKIETQLKKGELGGQQSEFFDPAFLTHTLFVGNKNYLIAQDEDQSFSIVYGIGYSFQQIIKNHYKLTSENQPSSNAEYIDGPTSVFNLSLAKKFSELTSININLNSLLLAKKDFLKSTSNVRFSSLLTADLEIGIVSIQYTNRIIYDKEISKKREIEQTLLFGVKINL